LERRRHDLQQPAGITDVVVDVEQPTVSLIAISGSGLSLVAVNGPV
jgi:hypothetical protein